MMAMNPGESDFREPDRDSWNWPAERIKKFGDRVIAAVANHLTRLPERPVFQPFPRALADRYLEFGPAPEFGDTEDHILDKFLSEIEPFPFGNGHPRFYGWVNSPPTVISIFAEMLAATMNPSCAGGNHAAIYVERQVINWFKHLLGFPLESVGLLVSGASMAALTALTVARHAKCGFDVRAQGVQGAPATLLLYKSGEGHACHQKAAELLGIGIQNVRTIEHDLAWRMRPDALDKCIQGDLAKGHRPLCVIASAGTVNTGAIDPLDEIADVCAKHNLWLHVDGAYGAPAILSGQYAPALKALSRADSVALDPHKWLYIPVEAGLVLVRDAAMMRAAFSLVPPYLRTDGNPEGVGGLPWFSEFGFQQTRGFRALKVWMVLQYHGLSGYRASIERDIQLAEHLSELLRNADDFELAEPQSLSIVCFRFAPPRLRDAPTALDFLNQAVLETTQLGGQVFLSSTVLHNNFWLRACIVNPRATMQHMAALVDTVREAGMSLVSAPDPALRTASNSARNSSIPLN